MARGGHSGLLTILTCFLLYLILVLTYDDYEKNGTFTRLVKHYTTHSPSDESETARVSAADSRVLFPTTKRYFNHKSIFMHNGIASTHINEQKGNGLIATEDIAFGEILSVELPIFKMFEDYEQEYIIPSNTQLLHYISSKVMHQLNQDTQFATAWSELDFNSQLMDQLSTSLEEAHERHLVEDEQLMHFSKYATNLFRAVKTTKPWAIYGALSRINHGLPQNVAAVFDGKGNNVCILIATTNIKKGDELLMDYYGDWNKPFAINDADYLFRRRVYGEYFDFDLNEEWIGVTRKLVDKTVSNEQKRDIIQNKLYHNGIVGKEFGKTFKMTSGCTSLNEDECDIKRAIKRTIQSTDIFKIIKGTKPPVPWMGRQFVTAMTELRLANE